MAIDGFGLDSRACATAFMPSRCGILVYKDETSMVTRMELGLTFLVVSIFLKKAPVSFMNEGRSAASGCR